MTRAVRDAARCVLRAEKFSEGRLDIAVVGDTTMRRLHAEYSNDDTTTDSLAFDLRDEPREGYVDGQLIACSSVARRRARSRGIDWRAELVLYIVHGSLHLCGYDDHTEEEAAARPVPKFEGFLNDDGGATP